jgi:hypothetical protein
MHVPVAKKLVLRQISSTHSHISAKSKSSMTRTQVTEVFFPPEAALMPRGWAKEAYEFAGLQAGVRGIPA